MDTLKIETVVVLTATLAAVGAVISTAEWLANWRHLRAGALLGWQQSGPQSPAQRVGARGRLRDFVYSFPCTIVILLIRLLLLLVVPFTLWFQKGHLWILGFILLTGFLIHRRHVQSMDGSDQMTEQVFGALMLGHIPGTALARESCLWYIAATSCFSYFASGAAKIASTDWRKGDAIFIIVNTRLFGHERAARFLARRINIAKVLCWGAIFAELSFPLILLAGYPGCLIFFAWGVTFHVMNALLMGLNCFPWAFVSTYPAILYCTVAIAAWFL